MTTRIRLINAMLATTGTAALSASDSRHPSYIKANNILEDVLEEFSTMSLWFNTSITTLLPNTDGRVLVPANTLTCDPVDGQNNYAIRGQYLFDTDNNTSIINKEVQCILVTQLDLSDLPPTAYQFIRAKARYEYFLDADGGQRKLDNYRALAEAKEYALINMNIKMQDTNWFSSPAYTAFINRRTGKGGRGYYSSTTDTRAQLGHGSY
jgi:hypothetical protein